MTAFLYAKFIVSKLVKAGHLAYFAGGWVRDYLMHHPSEDIDIATSASPVEIMDLFSNTILVGLSFGVVIVVVEDHQFEVATFRKDLAYVDGRHPSGIEMSNPTEDALRRDFTINGLFYDPIEETIHDFVNGQEDIQRGLIRTIGDPEERFFEDRLRMLRAFRFSARFGFPIHFDTQEAIRDNADKLFPAVAMERVWQEFNKMAVYPRFDQALIDMQRLGILTIIFPELQEMHLNDLKQRVMIFPKFPLHTPTILYLLELFTELSLAKKIEMGKRLRVKNSDLKMIEFIHELFTTITEEDHALQHWSHLLAHPDSSLGLSIYQTRLQENDSLAFSNLLIERTERLAPHIERLQGHTPLVNAAHLQEIGIKPGKQLGLLLKEAEKIAIERDLNNPDPVLNALRNSSAWIGLS